MSRGGNVQNAWNSCQLSSTTTWNTAAPTLVRTLTPQQLADLQAKFANWMTSKNVS